MCTSNVLSKSSIIIDHNSTFGMANKLIKLRDNIKLNKEELNILKELQNNSEIIIKHVKKVELGLFWTGKIILLKRRDS